MNTEKTWQTTSLSSNDTYAIGERLGRACRGSEIFLFISDLGGGKTTLISGLARGLDSQEHVSSPTFTISKVYKCRDDLELHHFDFYRLTNAGVVAHELSEVMSNPLSVVAIEWGNIVKDELPAKRIEITINQVADGQNKRNITITYPPEFDYVMEQIG